MSPPNIQTIRITSCQFYQLYIWSTLLIIQPVYQPVHIIIPQIQSKYHSGGILKIPIQALPTSRVDVYGVLAPSGLGDVWRHHCRDPSKSPYHKAKSDMAELRRVTGAKLLITKALLHKRDKPWTYDGYSSVADLPRLLEKSERLATFCSYMYSTVCMVLHFIEKDKSTVAILAEPGYEVYVAGDPSGCIRVKVPLSTEYRPLEGNTYILTDAALLVTRGMLHIKAIGGTRLLPCHNSDLHVLRSNDISRNYTCELTRNDGIVPPMAP